MCQNCVERENSRSSPSSIYIGDSYLCRIRSEKKKGPKCTLRLSRCTISLRVLPEGYQTAQSYRLLGFIVVEEQVSREEG